VVVESSAKPTEDNEITPHSDFVKIWDDGQCIWEPRYDLSASLCYVDVTWYPFDSQSCNLIFESWILEDSHLNITIDHSSDVYEFYVDSDEWNLSCVCN